MNEVYQTLITLQDDTRSQKMAAYMRHQFTFLGVTAPIRRQVAKTALRQAQAAGVIDWLFVDVCWQSQYREHHYLAIDYLVAMTAYLKKEDLSKIEAMLLQHPWWDSIDAFSEVISKMVIQEPVLKQEMLRWSTSESLWLRRSAIIHQLLLKKQADTELLRIILLNNFGTKEFFINKSIGWSLREYAKTDPAWVRHFIATYRDQMSSLSIREASKYLNR